MTAKKKRSDGEGSIYFDKSRNKFVGALVLGYRDKKPIRKKVSAATRSGAAGKLRELREQHAAHTLPQGKVPTVEQWMNTWYGTILPRTAKPLTLAGYNAKVNHYIIPLLGHHRLDRLTPEHIEAAWDVLFEVGNPTLDDPEPLAQNTIHQTHRILARALRVAVQRKHIKSNPAGFDSMDAPKRVDVEFVPLSPTEVQLVLAQAEGSWNSARWSVALALGLRQGEALGLRWIDVDLSDNVIHVRQTLNRISGKGLVFGEPKSKTGVRDIALPASLVAKMRAHKKTQNQAKLRAGDHWADTGLVFTLEDGRPIDPSVDARRWRQLLTDAGVPHRRLHDARHTAATMLLAQGVSTRVAMQILGHSQISVTMRYQHVVDEMQRDAAAKMDTALWGKSGG